MNHTLTQRDLRRAERLARRYASRWNRDVSDICSAAYEGLVLAANTFKPDMGATFATWSCIKMRSVIFDEARAESWLPKDVVRAMKRAGIELPQRRQLDDSWPDETLLPSELVEQEEVRREVRRVVGTLSRQERKLIRAVYVDDQTIEESGKHFGLSRSWTWRIHTRMLWRLACRMPKELAS